MNTGICGESLGFRFSRAVIPAGLQCALIKIEKTHKKGDAGNTCIALLILREVFKCHSA